MREIFFYLPEDDASFARLPGSIDDYWDWQASTPGLAKYWGRYHWVLQTYLYLRQGGLPVHLCNQLPQAGIIVTHLDCVAYDFRPGSGQTLVVLLVDRETPHPHAHLHITHNPVQGLPFGMAHRYMPPWPQVGLIPRDSGRGDSFTRIGYFGYDNNLDPAFAAAEFQAQMAELGLQFHIPPPSAWHDFSTVDAVVAIRKFGRDDPFLNKPSLKLFNAWLADVPAVLGHETAYRHDGKPGVDYLEATTPADVLSALRNLKLDVAQRHAMVAQGRLAVEPYKPASTVARWGRLIDAVLRPLDQAYAPPSTRRALKAITGPVLERLLWRQAGRFPRRPSPML